MPVRTHLAYAYPRKARESLHGRVHLVVDNDLHAGRLHRRTGDALCKPRSGFWGLTDGEDDLCRGGITCTPCAARHERLVAIAVLEPHGGKVHGPRVALDAGHGGIVYVPEPTGTDVPMSPWMATLVEALEPPSFDIRSDGRTVWVDADTGFTVARFGMLGVDVHTPDTTACLDCTHGPTGPAEWDRFVASVHRHYGIVVPDEHRPAHCRK